MEQEINVISISHLFLPHVGGVETFAYNLLSFLVSKPHIKTTAIFCSSENYTRQENGILKMSIRAKMLFGGLYPFVTLKFFFTVLKFFLKTKNKVVIINGRHFTTSYIAFVLCVLMRINYIYIDSGFQPNIFKSGGANKLMAFLDKFVFGSIVFKAKAVVAISEYTKNILINLHPKIKDRVIVINTGFNSDKVSKYDITKKEKTISFISRISIVKDPETVAKAYEILSTKYPNWKFQLIGKGDFEIKPGDYSYPSNVSVQNRLLPQEEVFSLLSTSSIFINSSLSEGFSLANQEASALGNVGVFSNAESNIEMAKTLGIDNLVFERKNIVDLVNKVSEAIKLCEKTNFKLNQEVSTKAFEKLSDKVLFEQYYTLVTTFRK
ncbi:MAG: glycosyltransferase family 4 protein [Candidatus Dojkabacteria bacterium]